MVFRSQGKEQYSTLLILPYPNIDNSNSWNFVLEQFGKEKFTVIEEYMDTPINFLSAKNIYFSRLPGSMLLSKDIEFIKSSIKQADKNDGLIQDPLFQRLSVTEGKKTDVNLYLNYAKASKLLSTFFAKKQRPILDHFSQWVELDLKFKKDELLMTGFTAHLDSSLYFLNAFNQESQEISIPEILPYDISFLLDIGFENYEKAQEKYLS